MQNVVPDMQNVKTEARLHCVTPAILHLFAHENFQAGLVVSDVLYFPKDPQFQQSDV